MNRRINITLPEETIELINKAVPERGRSRLIDSAVRGYLDKAPDARLRAELAEGYKRRAGEALRIAEEWFPLDEEAWEKRTP